MKILIFSLMLILSLVKAEDWIKQFPDPLTAEDLNSVYFVDSDTGFVVGENGVIGKTIDKGDSFDPIQSTVDEDLNDIEFYSSEIGYICGNDGIILKTTDGGNNWTRIVIGSSEDLLYISIDNTNIWFSGKNGTVYMIDQTNDQVFNRSPQNGSDLYFVKFKDGAGYAGGKNSNLFRSENNGLTWNLLLYDTSNALYPLYYSSHPVYYQNLIFSDILFNNDGSETLLLNYIEDSFMSGFILTSDNHGESWNIGEQDFSDPLTSFHFIDEMNGWMLAVDPSFYFGDKYDSKYYNPMLLKTTDGGVNWEIVVELEYIFSYSTPTKVFFTDSLNGCITNRDGAVLRTNDGGLTWTTQIDYIDSPFINIVANEQELMFSSDSKIYFSDDSGNNCELRFDINQTCTNIVFSEQYKYVFGADKFFKSDDNFENYDIYNLPPSTGGSRGVFFFDDNKVIVAGLHDIYKSFDGGENWESIYYNDDITIDRIKFDNENKAWLVEKTGNNKGKLFRTTNGGYDWEENTNFDFNMPNPSIYFKDNTVFVGPHYEEDWSSTYILKSIDNGLTWNPILMPSAVNCFNHDNIQFVDDNNGWISVSSDNFNPDLLKTTDGGETWEGINYTFTNTGDYLDILFIDENIGWVSYDKKLYKTTNGGGVKVEEETVCKSLKLLGNYPNPFNPTTTIKYEIPNSGIVSLIIYNSNGELVRSLNENAIRSGIHEYKFDGSNLSSGVYHYSINFEEKMMSGKIVLIK
ncbi:MAG: T9SS type A sorting domain-containing protein [Candidatus Delongbacteria bacterium]|nr:T9SS type A sorting domain-containing protein [Candidatus Delongbacteria bacterium]MBN2834130.1 T9SS type A sorting domain-containing protein [Candidatus Delongbacteria bacterium]